VSVIVMPAGLLVGQWSFGQLDYGMSEPSVATGASRDRAFGPPRWFIGMSSPGGVDLSQSGLWEAMILQLRGRLNHLKAWDITRPAPEGTMRGTPTLNATVTAGATTMVLTGVTNGDTLLAGDWLQIGDGLGTSQLVKVMANATASGGTMSVTFEPPLRAGFSSSTAVTWDKASAYFKRSTARSSWRAAPGSMLVGGHQLDLSERFN